jgi:transposase
MNIPVIYVDESGFSEDMPGTSGCAPKGMRCFGTHDRQAEQRTNAVGALTGDRLLTTALFGCSINTDVFEAWIRPELLPVLTNGNVVVMDNASFHKSGKIQDLIEAAGCLPEFLPPYSPDLNPIEHKWAQAEARRRKLRCSVDELFRQPDL